MKEEQNNKDGMMYTEQRTAARAVSLGRIFRDDVLGLNWVREVIAVRSIKYTKKKIRNDLRSQISSCTKETPGTCHYSNPG